MTDHPSADLCPQLALVGDHSPEIRAHLRIPVILNALKQHHQIEVHSHWIPTGEAATYPDFTGFDGVWLLPGSPYRSEAGALTAIRSARTQGIPFLGTCGGFQHAVLEYARHVCGITDASHAESDPDGARSVISRLPAPLVGQKAQVRVVPGSTPSAWVSPDRTRALNSLTRAALSGRTAPLARSP
jgi:CTP synthase (UTP-ammonia lyase)